MYRVWLQVFVDHSASNTNIFAYRHNDLAWNLYSHLNNKLAEFNFTANLTEDSVWGTAACSSCFTDLPRLKAGKVGAQVSGLNSRTLGSGKC